MRPPPAIPLRLTDEQSTRLLRFINKKMGSKVRRWAEPEDVYQATLAGVLTEKRSKLAGLNEAQLMGYLFRCARSRIVDLSRRRSGDHGESAVEGEGAQPPQPSMGPVTRADELNRTFQSIDKLPPKYADVIRCVAVEGMKPDQAAQTLGLTEACVRKRLERARDQLRRHLNPSEYPEFSDDL